MKKINDKKNKVHDFLIKQNNLKIHYFEDMYQKIAKKEKNKHRILLYKCILILNNK